MNENSTLPITITHHGPHGVQRANGAVHLNDLHHTYQESEEADI